MFVAVSLLFNGLAWAGRHAIVLGNDAYRHISPLKNAVFDAQSMAKALEDTGFNTTLAVNLDYKSMKDALRTFRQRVNGGDEVVVFFSGHGVNLDGQNFLLPVDVRAESAETLRDDGISLAQALADLRSQRPGFTLVIMDACRNNPFEGKTRALGGRGLAAPSGAAGEMILFSAGEGQTALDRLGSHDNANNGLFTRVLLQEMKRPGVPVDQVMKSVRAEVYRLAKSINHEQVPALYDQVIGQYFFVPGAPNPAPGGSSAALTPPAAPPAPGPAGAPVVATPQPSSQQASIAPPAPAARPRPSAAEQEARDWEAARNARSAVALDLFMSKYPQSRFMDSARLLRRKFNQASSLPRPDSGPSPFN